MKEPYYIGRPLTELHAINNKLEVLNTYIAIKNGNTYASVSNGIIPNFNAVEKNASGLHVNFMMKNISYLNAKMTSLWISILLAKP